MRMSERFINNQNERVNAGTRKREFEGNVKLILYLVLCVRYKFRRIKSL
jgi:hypothetical protein